MRMRDDPVWLREQLDIACTALEKIADPPMGDDYSAPREYAEWLREQARHALMDMTGRAA